jgi:putative PIN family toxin of toxin-antitoxin system
MRQRICYHMLMIVVLDTNIFVSALLGPAGASRAVLRACLDGRLQPLMGAALFAEYESLMGRSQVFEGCLLSPMERETLLNSFLSVCRWTTIYFGWRPNLRDEGDNHLIELAVAGGASAIVTKNTRDFLSAELLFPSLRILLPEEVLQEI